MSGWFVYVAQSDATGLIKIGVSCDPKNRPRQAGAPRVLRLIPGDIIVERWMQSRFAGDWIKGEWFNFNPRMLDCAVPEDVIAASARSMDCSPHKDRRPVRGSLDEAIEKAGGISALAKRLGVSKQAVHQWRSCPPTKVLQVEKLTGVSRYELRPDIYGKRAA